MHLAIEDSLGAIGEAAVPRLSALLERGTDENRRRAAAALGKTQHAGAYAPLARSIASPETPATVRGWAIGALRLVPGEAAEQLLLQLVQSDHNDTALGAAGSLGDRKSVVALPLMEAVCRKQAEPIARERCLGYIGRVGGPEAARLLAQKLRTEPSAYVRVNVARFLGDTDSEEVTAALDAAAASRQLEVDTGAYPYFLRASPPVADQLIVEAYHRFGTSEMGEAMRASRRPALVAAADAEARQPVQRPKVSRSAEPNRGRQWSSKIDLEVNGARWPSRSSKSVAAS